MLAGGNRYGFADQEEPVLFTVLQKKPGTLAPGDYEHGLGAVEQEPGGTLMLPEGGIEELVGGQFQDREYAADRHVGLDVRRSVQRIERNAVTRRRVDPGQGFAFLGGEEAERDIRKFSLENPVGEQVQRLLDVAAGVFTATEGIGVAEVVAGDQPRQPGSTPGHGANDPRNYIAARILLCPQIK